MTKFISYQNNCIHVNYEDLYGAIYHFNNSYRYLEYYNMMVNNVNTIKIFFKDYYITCNNLGLFKYFDNNVDKPVLITENMILEYQGCLWKFNINDDNYEIICEGLRSFIIKQNKHETSFKLYIKCLFEYDNVKNIVDWECNFENNSITINKVTDSNTMGLSYTINFDKNNFSKLSLSSYSEEFNNSIQYFNDNGDWITKIKSIKYSKIKSKRCCYLYKSNFENNDISKLMSNIDEIIGCSYCMLFVEELLPFIKSHIDN